MHFFFTTEYDVSCRVSVYLLVLWRLFTRLRKVTSIPSLLRVFITDGYWAFKNVFSVSIDITMWFFFFLLIWKIAMTGFQMLTQLCIPGIMCCMSFFMYCWYIAFLYIVQFWWRFLCLRDIVHERFLCMRDIDL